MDRREREREKKEQKMHECDEIKAHKKMGYTIRHEIQQVNKNAADSLLEHINTWMAGH